jgi:hypothetical protein
MHRHTVYFFLTYVHAQGLCLKGKNIFPFFSYAHAHDIFFSFLIMHTHRISLERSFFETTRASSIVPATSVHASPPAPQETGTPVHRRRTRLLIFVCPCHRRPVLSTGAHFCFGHRCPYPSALIDLLTTGVHIVCR